MRLFSVCQKILTKNRFENHHYYGLEGAVTLRSESWWRYDCCAQRRYPSKLGSKLGTHTSLDSMVTFANIAHGCNSVLATVGLSNMPTMRCHRQLVSVLDSVLKTIIGQVSYIHLRPAVVVLVATIRALKRCTVVAKSDLAEEPSCCGWFAKLETSGKTSAAYGSASSRCHQ